MFVLIGSIVYPQAAEQLPTTTDGCQFNTTSSFAALTELYSDSQPMSNVEYEDNFLLNIVHIAFLLVPVSGFIISFVLGIIVSLLTGGLNIVNQVNPMHLNPIAWYAFLHCFSLNIRYINFCIKISFQAYLAKELCASYEKR